MCSVLRKSCLVVAVESCISERVKEHGDGNE